MRSLGTVWLIVSGTAIAIMGLIGENSMEPWTFADRAWAVAWGGVTVLAAIFREGRTR